MSDIQIVAHGHHRRVEPLLRRTGHMEDRGDIVRG
jgi:hypothetical protein